MVLLVLSVLAPAACNNTFSSTMDLIRDIEDGIYDPDTSPDGTDAPETEEEAGDPPEVLYVSLAGSDGNPGNDPTAPLQTIQAALDRAAPGQAVYIAGGYYLEGLLEVTSVVELLGGWNASFTAHDPLANPTTVRTSATELSEGFPVGTFTVRTGADITLRHLRIESGIIEGAAVTHAIYIDGGSVRLLNTRIAVGTGYDSFSAAASYGVRAAGASSILVDNSLFLMGDDLLLPGTVHAVEASAFSGTMTIRNSTVAPIAAATVPVAALYLPVEIAAVDNAVIVIDGNLFERASQNQTLETTVINMVETGATGPRFLIRDNRISEVLNGIGDNTGISVGSSAETEIRGNILDWRGADRDIEGLHVGIDITGAHQVSPVVWGNRIAQAGSDNITTSVRISGTSALVANNVVRMEGAESFWVINIESGATETDIIHNTIVVDPTSIGSDKLLVFFGELPSGSLANNVFLNLETGETAALVYPGGNPDAAHVIHNNLFFGMSELAMLLGGDNYTDVASLDGTIWAANNIQADPLLVTGLIDSELWYAPGPGSPAIDAGTPDYLFLVPEDNRGATRADPVTIGAYEM